jgi:protein-disulfide isomerase
MAQGQRGFQIVLGLVVVGGAVFIATRMMGGKPVSIPANVVVTAADTSGFRGYVIGDANAPVEITEYGDFQCPGCANFDQVQWPTVVTTLIKPGKARFRFRDFPLDNIHSHTRVASHAAACADEQGKFWDVKEQLFARQNDWAYKSDPMPVYKEIMQATGVDGVKWMDCMKSAKYAGRIQASSEEGTKLGVSTTPSFLVGDRLYVGANSDQLAHLVDSLSALGPAAQAAPKKP